MTGVFGVHMLLPSVELYPKNKKMDFLTLKMTSERPFDKTCGFSSKKSTEKWHFDRVKDLRIKI